MVQPQVRPVMPRHNAHTGGEPEYDFRSSHINAVADGEFVRKHDRDEVIRFHKQVRFRTFDEAHKAGRA